MCLRLITVQLLLAIAVANAGNDPPPNADRTWSPPNLSNYESELAGQRFKNGEGSSRVSINPRKVYNLAELIDIAERNNPETRVAWERARQAAAAVGLSESAYYPFLVASAAAGYDRAFIPFPTLAVRKAPQVGWSSPKYFEPPMVTSSSVSLTCASIATLG